MSDNNIVWARHGQLPVRTDAVRSEEFQSMTDHLIIAGQTMVYLPNPYYLWPQVGEAVDTMLQRALNPSRSDFTSPANALLIAQETLQSQIDSLLANQ